MVTVDVAGSGPRWLKVRDLTRGVTYFFRVQARTIAYGPELQANVTAGPAEGEWAPSVGAEPRQRGTGGLRASSKASVHALPTARSAPVSSFLGVKCGKP